VIILPAFSVPSRRVRLGAVYNIPIFTYPCVDRICLPIHRNTSWHLKDAEPGLVNEFPGNREQQNKGVLPRLLHLTVDLCPFCHEFDGFLFHALFQGVIVANALAGSVVAHILSDLH
jgi:hypothetical protein